jgi:hypothetical protein
MAVQAERDCPSLAGDPWWLGPQRAVRTYLKNYLARISGTIRVESLTKVYGPKEARAAALLRQGLSREEIRRTTAATVAVEDVSFSVKAGETFVERKTLCAIESNRLG